MTTATTSNFNAQRDLIIKRSLRMLGAFASGETVDAQTISDCAFALNAMTKEWNAIGIHLWTETEATLFLQPNQVQYVLGPDSTDNATQSFVQTATSAAGLSVGATSISVLSIAGMHANDKIGIVVNGGGTFWTTINGAPSGTTVALASGLTTGAPPSTPVYTYTTRITRPLRIEGGRRFHLASSIETPMIPLSRLDYRNLPDKLDTGTVTQYFYDPQVQGSNTTWTGDNGYFTVWPAPADSSDAVKFTWARSLLDFDTASNTPDFPSEWLNCLSWNLAVQMAPEFDVPPPRYEMVKEQAAISLDRVTGWDREPESIYFGVDFDPMRQR